MISSPTAEVNYLIRRSSWYNVTMTITDHIFSHNLQNLVNVNPIPAEGEISPSIPVHIPNIERDLAELAVAGIYSSSSRSILWIVGENENLAEKKTKLEMWMNFLGLTTSDIFIHFYPLPFEDPYINNETDIDAIGQKCRLIADIVKQRRLIVLTTLSALNIKIENKNKLPGFFLEIEKNQTTSRSDLIRQLNEMGYKTCNIVEEQGDIAWRGSIVDVFPIDRVNPVRIEIEGDTAVSLRLFDPSTQKSLQRLQSIVIPISHFFSEYPKTTDYFIHPGENHIEMEYLPSLLGDYDTIVSDIQKITEEFQKLALHYERIYESVSGTPDTPPKPGEIFQFPFPGYFETNRIISIDDSWDPISQPVEWIKGKKTAIDMNLVDIKEINENIEKKGYRLHICSTDSHLIENFKENFKSFVSIEARIPHSFENRQTKSLFLADKPFHFIQSEAIERNKGQKPEAFIEEIRLDDLVVHRKHGIGKFVGFKKLTFEVHVAEFLKIEYMNNEYLYVPVYELDVLSKYSAFEGVIPKVDKLGGATWALKQKKAKKSIITFARELLELYAMRKAIKGVSYVKDYDWEEKVKDDFEFVETEDQKKAIREVLTDLEADFPMDRLLCGDVSFGKTEVALRAALRVVTNGKQAAILCPTTILAYQHFTTFSRRFERFPITIAMLSRMVSPKKRKAICKGLGEGKIDIVIGTHSLISKGVTFKRLGLYIIDEEQRFGVFQKEKIKTNREEVDVLSMSATPIPRTLSLSMAGLHDISIIQTPPIGRIAIKNYVGYFSKEIVMSAVMKELERDGSVFIVYNSIDRIFSFKKDLRQWMPNVSSVVIHAKMNPEEIEANLMAFIDKKYRVLISTTIIENGIDIPNVNTLIILDADRFGLTQLYQLRGRIGRGNRQAYAYFLLRTMDITEKARARLDAIRDFADLGSGYKLAEFDLQLRGAGSLLGNKQHGHIEALGFEYYHRLLVKTIKELKGEIETKKEGKVNIHFSYSVDSAYIKNSSERIMFYRRILEAGDFQSLEDLKMELEDRYGRRPESIEKIFFAGFVRVLVREWAIDEVDVFLDKLVIKFIDPKTIPNLSKFGNRIEIVDNKTRVLYLKDYRVFMTPSLSSSL